jgi:hypothetical protein
MREKQTLNEFYAWGSGNPGLSKKSHENQKPRILQTQNAAKVA